MQAIWDFLRDPANQTTLTWLGGGVVVLAGGLWAAVTFFAAKPEGGGGKPGVSADRGGFAAGRDNNVKINQPPPVPRAPPKK